MPSTPIVVLCFFLPFTLTLARSEHMAVKSLQEPFSNNPAPSISNATPESAKERVPGNNSAYYYGPASKDQLLYIEEFDVVPDPPPM